MLRIESIFSGLSGSDYTIESSSTPNYNCIAWAAGSDDRWWEPDSLNLYYWPEGCRREWTLEALIELFELLGFELCDGPELETGFVKIAIYAGVDGKPKHAARQLPSGKWTSKLGPREDIDHRDLESLEGAEYGSVRVIMRRSKPTGAQEPNLIARIFHYLVTTIKARLR